MPVLSEMPKKNTKKESSKMDAIPISNQSSGQAGKIKLDNPKTANHPDS